MVRGAMNSAERDDDPGFSVRAGKSGDVSLAEISGYPNGITRHLMQKIVA